MERKVSVLVVDNEQPLADAVGGLLETLGCQVTVAYDALEAVHIAGQVLFDMVLTDYDMGPGMNGVELAASLYEIDPALTFFMMSGTPPDDFGPHIPRERFYRKPVARAQLAMMVAAVERKKK